ncbi:P-loop containing nucleoside triphosphate hydrolase protein [Sodiomyces alkalinus F11]|uniref:Ribosome assembly protein 1 n=1 Tax=Sodiomyces alkalinus (strain CBS 110278 / VKM F-3762 / F11) TaxID=1314773 RepID=A0A3N2PVF7_SODAK|nr:P-loop containing nucleoside triphosphate hydrolase protein [Sodiomyces alkalinus F11]ROT38481.1 P-loop containing nucleoside triphosphate hydrolase protein [Sodiomyces alkalinus F11]
MPLVTPAKLASLQRHADNVRNICILAHVDHGKTSLTDALIATNGIISPKMAGKIRYLDSRPDEQLRGITMESSAISLFFSMLRRPSPDAAPEPAEYLINLIDSPGHIDFSSEVSTASRLCDGAVVLVDAVEGVCSQTVTVLRQTWMEKLKPLLVFNKIDRLVTELKMTPNEAYVHLGKLLEQVNAVLGSFFQGERMEEDLNWREKMEERVRAAAAGKESSDSSDHVTDSGELQFEERDDEDLYFAPEKNNVIFSSAIDGWAFTVRQFASLYEKKLGIKRGVMEKVLWGGFYLDPKTKKILAHRHLKGRNLKPMFVQLVLEPIWTVYQATVGGDNGKGDPALLEKITKSLGLTIPPHIMRSRDSRVLLTTVFSQWLPLSTALLVSVIESLPAPPAAQAERLLEMVEDSPGGIHVDNNIVDAMVSFRASKSDPVVAYVSKMVSVPESELPQNKRRTGQLSPEEARELARKKRAEAARAQAAATAAEAGTGGRSGSGVDDDLSQALEEVSLDNFTPQLEEEQHDPEHLIGFGRMYSGSLSVGDELYVIPPKWSPANPHSPEPEKVTITALYMLMGRNLEALDTVPAGVVFGIGGLEGHILKSGTLCSQVEGAVNLSGISTLGKPIVRVALEPVNPADLDKMIRGLKLLVQSDPCAEYETMESGEHVLLTAGELHLERCLTDLQERFARCEIQAGAPIVPYRETIVKADEMRPPANKELGRGVVVGVTSSKQVSVRIRVRPLPENATEFLIKNSNSLKRMYSDYRTNGAGNGHGNENGNAQQQEGGVENVEADINLTDAAKTLSLDEFKQQLQAQLDSNGGRDKETWKNTMDKIVAFGPRRTGPNLLIDGTSEGIFSKVFSAQHARNGGSAAASAAPQADESLHPVHLADKIAHAFQLATAEGPLCHEPVQGIAVTVEDVIIHAPPESDDPSSSSSSSASSARDRLTRLTGEVIKTTASSLHAALLDWSPRLLLAIYSVEIQASTEVLGRVYDVLTRRRGRVLSEAMKEGTPFFTIASVVPVVESFGFADEMRKRTSGAAQPQLLFAGFEVLDEDPFWVPFTEDDLEDLGEWADRENVAKRYMDGVRKRKGLLVEGRNIATNAEKQKTLKR